jgi:hypothetical protein
MFRFLGPGVLGVLLVGVLPALGDAPPPIQVAQSFANHTITYRFILPGVAGQYDAYHVIWTGPNHPADQEEHRRGFVDNQGYNAYIIQNVEPGATYTFKVQAVKKAPRGTFAQDKVGPWQDAPVVVAEDASFPRNFRPNAPTHLKATRVEGTNQVRVSWTPGDYGSDNTGTTFLVEHCNTDAPALYVMASPHATATPNISWKIISGALGSNVHQFTATLPPAPKGQASWFMVIAGNKNGRNVAVVQETTIPNLNKVMKKDPLGSPNIR